MQRKGRGSWVSFGSRNPGAPTVMLSTPCISTCSESAGHFTTVSSTGKISAVSSEVKASPRSVQDGSSRDRE
jgi:hypothetical protein